MHRFKTILSIPALIFCTQVIAANIPLKFDMTHGTYFMTVDFTNQKPLPLMLDTGSSNLNVVGNKKICTKCTLLIDNLRFTPNPSFLLDKNHFYMRYGLGDGMLHPYKSTVQINPNLQLDDFDFGIYQQGQNINNIIGFAYPDAAAPRKNPMPVFFTELNQKYHLDNQFTTLLCDTRAPSKLFLGPLPKNLEIQMHHTVPITHQSLYFIKQYGVSDAKNNQLIRFDKGYNAIVDSGTSAKIIFPDASLAPLIRYLKQTRSPKNKDLPEAFWQGQTCIHKNLIDPGAFPTLYFHFRNKQGKEFKLRLPAKRYITENACGKDYYKLAFIGYHTNKNDENILNHKAKLPNFIILGTPFLEEYMTTFHQYQPAELRFYNSEKLCNTSYQAKIITTHSSPK